MPSDPARFAAALEAFDLANADDPHTVLADGQAVPKELLYARRMTAWLHRLEPSAPEPLQLAVRAQHLCRWMIPRESYPAGRAGYRAWRTELGRFHADRAGRILAAVGYEPDTIARVQALLRKERLKTDPWTQTLEDVACLVFLEHYLDEFAPQHPADKVVGILRKTWRKLSDRGRETALALPLSPRCRELVARALAGSDSAAEDDA